VGPLPVHPLHGLPFTGVRTQRTKRLSTLLALTLLLGAAMIGHAQSPRKSRVRTLRMTPFYDAPQPLPAGKLGDLIRSESFDDYDLPLSVNVVRILYHSRSASGQDVATSGVVLFPADKKAPSGGWPVIAWAHGVTGVARDCAPSLRRNLGHGPFLSMYVNLGYAVVATDYTGLGTSFRNAFLDAPSNATDVIASIPAARQALPQIGSRWVVMGVAEGGLAAIAVAQKENEIRDSGYLGAIVVSDMATAKEMLGPQLSSSITLASLAYGTKTVYPDFQPSDMLTEKGMALYHRIEQTCSDMGSGFEPSLTESVKPSWDQHKLLLRYLDRSTPEVSHTHGPVLMISSDHAPSTSEAISRMCGLGDQVQWLHFSDLDPGRVIGDSVRDQIAWIEARFSGRNATGACGGTP
jgi:pimeloyl-ACP methyl ester carboxylesterase